MIFRAYKNQSASELFAFALLNPLAPPTTAYLLVRRVLCLLSRMTHDLLLLPQMTLNLLPQMALNLLLLRPKQISCL
ncbi:hypothetical protein DM01DRAFT_1337146 [Hesseltinella vesiculosa]|uniref:Uncharacterized protein n=1 Tax=Hesseltinella vesiculosa TaxID=101127 RepID=A0A1X2GE22_9FUNG|nr:hypothetical protein DM01DRAFT_1337146 [Hesseltinella vesiculosa]